MIIRAFLATMLLAISFGVSALNVELGIEYQMTREDGSALGASDIARTTVYAGDAVLISVNGAPDAVTVDIPICAASSLTATVTDTQGLESARSAALSVLICRPSAPRLSGVRVPPAGP